MDANERREFLLGKGYSLSGDVATKTVFENGPFWTEVNELHNDYLQWFEQTNPSGVNATLKEYSLRTSAPFDELELIDPWGRVRGSVIIRWDITSGDPNAQA